MEYFNKHICGFILVVLVSILFYSPSYSQFQNTPVKLTFGEDRNPAFHIRNENLDLSHLNFEFLAYERVNINSTNICVSKINTSGAIDSGTYLTNNSFQNINPSMGFYGQNYSQTEIINSIVVWETNKNGNKDVYARIYKQNQGWLGEFPIDSSAGDQLTARVALINTSIYAIVYKSVNDIKLKIINVDTRVITLDTNLTSGINEVCKNPYLAITSGTPKRLYISYEREYSQSQNSIYCFKADTIANPIVLASDTVRYSGVNYNAGLYPMVYYPNPFLCVYETYVNGKRNTFGTEIKWNGQSSVHHNILTSTASDMWSYRGSAFILGDNTLDGTYGFLTKVGNSIYMKTKMIYSWDSVSVLVSNDTNYKSKLTLSTANAIPNSACLRMWYTFEKNLSPSDRGIYGISFTSCAMNIRKLNETATSFSLAQNYPNPFNSTSKLKFQIANLGDVKIVVYDVMGREVQTLVNERLGAGVYEVSFDGNRLNSGIYFYQLKAGDFIQTKRMILIK